MASISKEKTTKDGRRYHVIRVSRGHGKSPYQMRWYRPKGWSDSAAIRALTNTAADFERRCKNGEVLNREEAKESERLEAIERAKIKTFRQYAEEVFMREKATTLSENARSNYEMFLRVHVFPSLAEIPISEITPAMISRLLVSFQESGKSHASAVKLYNVLNGVFGMAYKHDAIPVSPMLKVDRPKPMKDEKMRDESTLALTEEKRDELVNLIRRLREEDRLSHRWYTYILLAAYTGARRGELCGLQWSDIDFAERLIIIKRNLQYTKARGVYETSPKTGASRVVDIGAEEIAALRELRDTQSKSCISKWVFSQDGTSEPIHPQSPTRFFKRFGEKYNIPHFHPHLLRHTVDSIMVTSGVDLKTVAARSGQSVEVLLRTYVHPNIENITDAGSIARGEAKKAQNE